MRRIAALFFPADKAVEVIGILPDGFGNEELGLLIQLQLGGSIGSDPAAVAHTIAVNDRQTGLQNGNRAGNVI